jgi:hypothetical protein
MSTSAYSGTGRKRSTPAGALSDASAGSDARARPVNGSPWRRLTDREARRVVEQWRAALGVIAAVRLERIRCSQVTDEHGQPGCSLVGVVYEGQTACIYHTRALTPEDIVHELLHVAHPAWPEERVVAETDRILAATPARDTVRAGRRAAGSGLPAAAGPPIRRSS